MPAKILNEPLPADYRGCYDRDAIGTWDLGGKEITLVIDDVKVGKLRKVGDDDEKPKEEKKILIWFRKGDQRAEKYMICNKTNAETLAGMYGNKPADWIGKRCTLYPTTTRAFGKTHECIRIKPKIPLESVKKETA